MYGDSDSEGSLPSLVDWRSGEDQHSLVSSYGESQGTMFRALREESVASGEAVLLTYQDDMCVVGEHLGPGEAHNRAQMCWQSAHNFQYQAWMAPEPSIRGLLSRQAALDFNRARVWEALAYEHEVRAMAETLGVWGARLVCHF